MGDGTERPFYAPNGPPAPARQPKPGARLFEFCRVRDHSRWLCELRDHGEYGVEAQFLKNEELFMVHTFNQRLDPMRTPREMAITWAEEQRKVIEAYEPA